MNIFRRAWWWVKAHVFQRKRYRFWQDAQNAGAGIPIDEVFKEGESFFVKHQIPWEIRHELNAGRDFDPSKGCCAPMDQGGFNGPTAPEKSPYEEGVKALQDMGVTGPGKALAAYRENQIAGKIVSESQEIRSDDPGWKRATRLGPVPFDFDGYEPRIQLTMRDLQDFYEDLCKGDEHPNLLITVSTTDIPTNAWASLVRKSLERKGWHVGVNEKGEVEIRSPEFKKG